MVSWTVGQIKVFKKARALKEKLTQKSKFCHRFLTLMSFRILIRQKNKNYPTIFGIYKNGINCITWNFTEFVRFLMNTKQVNLNEKNCDIGVCEH